jgi:hypothetical protein
MALSTVRTPPPGESPQDRQPCLRAPTSKGAGPRRALRKRRKLRPDSRATQTRSNRPDRSTMPIIDFLRTTHGHPLYLCAACDSPTPGPNCSCWRRSSAGTRMSTPELDTPPSHGAGAGARALAPAGAPAQPPRCAARGRVPASPGTEARDGPGSGRARTSHHCGTPVKPPYTGRQGLSRGSANGGSSGTWVRGMDRARRRARRANAARSRGGSLDLLEVNSAITADGSIQRGHGASITGAADGERCGQPQPQTACAAGHRICSAVRRPCRNSAAGLPRLWYRRNRR